MKFLKFLERALKPYVPQAARKYLRKSKYELVTTRAKPIELVVHVGAHFGEDAAVYEALGAKTVLWIEADPTTYETLVKEMGARATGTTHLTENALISAETGSEVAFHIFSGDGASSSVHQASDAFRARFDQVAETGEVLSLPTRTLNDVLRTHGVDPTTARHAMLVLDVQGHEFEVLKGIGDGLGAFVFCKCEVSRVPFYEGGADFATLHQHFEAQGFKLVSHRPRGIPRHGDVLYQRA